MRTVEFDLISTLLVSMVVLFVGRALATRVAVLARLNTPPRSSAEAWWPSSWPGVKTGETRPGKLIRVHGSSTSRWADGRGQGVDATTSGVARVAAPGDAAPPSRSKQLIDRLAALVGDPAARRQSPGRADDL